MLDNLSSCVTNSDNEVKSLKDRCSKLENENKDLRELLNKKTKDFEGLYAAIQYNFEE